MKIVYSNNIEDSQLPLELNISFNKVIDSYRKYAKDKESLYHKSSLDILKELEKYPELENGFSDFSLLEKYKEPIKLLLAPLFPEQLATNEIKAIAIPFDFTSFNLTERFKNILNNAGKDFELKIRDYQDTQMYIAACTFILEACYGKSIDLRRPFYFDIPNMKLGITEHYRVAFNADFAEIYPSDNAPEITEDDIKMLLNNFDNIDVWKEKFPPNSYIFKGFGMINLFDVTADETVSSLKATLLKQDENVIEEMRKSLSELYRISDLKIGFSVFDLSANMSTCFKIKKSESLIINKNDEVSCSTFFCEGIINKVFKNKESVAISDIEAYGKATDYNQFYQNLKKREIQSIILIPIEASDHYFTLIEIASPRAYELNSVSQQKLLDVIPVFQTAIERASEEHSNSIEATIQEHYTSIHPTVKWRFTEAAENYFTDKHSGIKDPSLDEIVFKNVNPLYGQADISGSSLARNNAIKQDLVTQLELAINVLNTACESEKLPIYAELMHRVKDCLHNVTQGLHAGDEVSILAFLKNDIYPVFNHIKTINSDLKALVEVYLNRIDSELKVVYEARKDYEDSVTLLNEKLTKYIDHKQDEAQAMFRHYFERYKTDGVEHNMYIGQSLVKDKTYNEIYLQNLRLWQLQLMLEMENVAHIARRTMKHDLKIASLVLVHSNPLAIKFRMDEKQFDVDGAYNIRYEIIKKRIDKAHIKGTDERLTTPGKLAIVYTQDNDAREYLKYLSYLQSKNILGEVEKLDVEDLQGVSGLKALRAEIIYNDDFDKNSSITIDELMKQIKA